MLPEFQELLNQFKGNLVFKNFLGKNSVTPDEHIYKIDTNDGTYYVFEIDYIENFKYIITLLHDNIGNFKHFVEVNHPVGRIEDSSPFQVAEVYTSPPDFDQIKQYANDKYTSFEGYFSL